ncbi:hypothetical protein G6F31_016092 [Rhizopus arrhizus]|nr:hypothetical protein G6F31_016092 [Rhizopus arrhizus]
MSIGVPQQVLEGTRGEVELQGVVGTEDLHVGAGAVGGAVDHATFGINEGIGRVAVAVHVHLLQRRFAIDVAHGRAQAEHVVEAVVEQRGEAVDTRVDAVEVRVTDERGGIEAASGGRQQRRRQRQELLAGAGPVVLVAGQQAEGAAFAAPADRRRKVDTVVLERIGLHV